MENWVIDELTELAEQGNADAQFQLGYLYLYGENIIPDKEKALYYWEQSAKQGNIDALCSLGEYYFHSNDYALNDVTAADYWKQAIRKGSIEAHYHLSKCYFLGSGVLEDHKKAVEHCHIAAEKGIAEAEWLLGEYYRVGFQNFQEAAKWYKKAAEQGLDKAQFSFGVFLNTEQRYESAAEWFEKSATQGYMLAQYNLGNYYLYGLGVPQNTEIAIEWFQKAADQGYEIAKNAINELHKKSEHNKELNSQNLQHMDEILHHSSCPFCKSVLDENEIKCSDCGAQKVEFYVTHYIVSASIGSVLFGFILSMLVTFLLGESYYNSSFMLKTWGIIGITIFITFIATMKFRKKDIKYKWKR